MIDHPDPLRYEKDHVFEGPSQQLVKKTPGSRCSSAISYDLYYSSTPLSTFG